MSTQLRRLYPEPAGQISIKDAYTAERPSPAGRPWVAVCMIASLDGSVVVNGSSRSLGNRTDMKVLLTLRSLADVVIVGAGTVRAEGYGPPSTAGLRVGVVTRTGLVDLDTPLFRSGAGFVIAPSNINLPTGHLGHPIDVIRAGGDEVDLHHALRQIPNLIPGATFVHAEGGPQFNGSLLAAGLIDELNLTTSPRMVGGSGQRINFGSRDTSENFELAHLLLDDSGYVFSRWVAT